MTSALLTLLALFVGLVGAQLIGLAFRIATAQSSKYSAAHEINPTVRSSVGGDLDPVRSGWGDYKVACGLAVDTNANRWITQGKISDEVIDGVIK